MSPKRLRLDDALVAAGRAPDKATAERWIRAGLVRVEDAPVDKPGFQVAPAAALTVHDPRGRFVSRAGSKLAAALEAFALDVAGARCLDVGIGTGGFTDCLLQAGAAHVTGVDVAYGQVAWSIRSDPRVRLFERTNFRTLRREALGDAFDVVCADCSFISLRLLVAPIAAAMRPGGTLVALVKPQFEAPADRVEDGGRVVEEADRREAVAAVEAAAKAVGLQLRGVIDSPTPGARAGNVEILACFLLSSPTIHP